MSNLEQHYNYTFSEQEKYCDSIACYLFEHDTYPDEETWARWIKEDFVSAEERQVIDKMLELYVDGR